MAHVLEFEPDEALDLCGKLVALGLADANGPYLLPDPALGAVLAMEMDLAQRAAAETRWRKEMQAFTGFLYRQRSKDVHVARQGTVAALIDLLEALEATSREAHAGRVSVDRAMSQATNLESLVSKIGQPRALDRVRYVREVLTKLVPAWSHARFIAESQQIDRLLEAGNLREACEVRAANATTTDPAAQALLKALDKIVASDRDPALAADPAHSPMNTVELQLLLEQISTGG